MTADSSQSKAIHIWSPNMYGPKGGIQVYSQFLFKALRRCYPDKRYSVFAKHDSNGSRGIPAAGEPRNVRFHSGGAWPPMLRTAAFAGQIVGLGVLERPELIISTHLNFTRAAYLLKRVFGIPYWAVAHGIEAWDIREAGLQRAIRAADRILAVSKYTRDRLLDGLQLDPSRVSVLPNTFDSESFRIGPKPQSLLRRYKLMKGQPIILTVSRLVASEQYKGYDRILRALPEIRHQIPNVHYIIAGHGDDRARVEELISELALEESVTLTGYISDDELCDHYNLCDVFAMPSKREGFGIVYLEALACGKPTLAGNKDGAVDALCNGELGALVDPDDIEAIAQTLIQMLRGTYSHPIMYKPDALRRKVIETYGFERFSEMLSGYLSEFFQSKSVSKSASHQA
jgi:glycosyltransferase involved in cell wall biosynthesis